MIKNLFDSPRLDDKSTDLRGVELGEVAINAFVAELVDPLKARWKYFSVSDSSYWWTN